MSTQECITKAAAAADATGNIIATKKLYRVLVACEPWFGSTGWGIFEAFRRLGHEVDVVNYRQFIPNVTTVRLKALRKLLMPWFVRDYNKGLIAAATNFKPQIFFAIKGSYILRDTVRRLRQAGVVTYNYYPDVSVFAHDKYIPKALPEYNHIFTTKSFQIADLKQRLGIDGVTFVPHGYVPDVHKPFELTQWERDRYSTDVSFVGTHTPKKERLLAAVHRALPNLKISIWGNLWTGRCRTPELTPFIMRQPVMGWAYSKAIQAAKINLGINSEVVFGASSGDLMSTRSFEIPACGGFMIHERNDEVRAFYAEDKEVVLFDKADELVEKVRYWLAHPDRRRTVAEAGYRRCVPAYSYDARVRSCLQLHDEAGENLSPSAGDTRTEKPFDRRNL